ncbi:MAG: DUF2971 domain-containing protein, partial [Candidatus Cloacimonetes bacterium]|nr:DUF2971 domain-containing protein [Candidatus Cloacimonadota bacterium]
FNDPHPDILYKYRDWEDSKHKRIITDLEIFFPSCKNLNDPFDCRIPIYVRNIGKNKQKIKENVHNYIQTIYPNLTRKQRREKEKQIYQEKNFSNRKLQEQLQYNIIDRRFGIFSLSANPRDNKLWADYAGSHRGICIGFDIDTIIEYELNKMELNKEVTLLEIKKVNYVTKFPQWELVSQDISLKQITTKSDKWINEEEYRLITIDKPNHCLKIPRKAIKELIFGLKTSEKTKKEIIQEIKKNRLHIKLYDIVQVPNTFHLELKSTN